MIGKTNATTGGKTGVTYRIRGTSNLTIPKSSWNQMTAAESITTYDNEICSDGFLTTNINLECQELAVIGGRGGTTARYRFSVPTDNLMEMISNPDTGLCELPDGTYVMSYLWNNQLNGASFQIEGGAFVRYTNSTYINWLYNSSNSTVTLPFYIISLADYTRY